jgi:drug/metabolite transporter (DMT)-like permease
MRSHRGDDRHRLKRDLALAIAAGGFVTLLGSLGDWSICSTTPCYVADRDFAFAAFSEMSGTDIGYGVATAIVGAVLMALGIAARRRGATSRSGSIGMVLAVLPLLILSGFLLRFYARPDESFTVSGPPAYGVLLVVSGSVLSLVAGALMRRQMVHSEGLS